MLLLINVRSTLPTLNNYPTKEMTSTTTTTAKAGCKKIMKLRPSGKTIIKTNLLVDFSNRKG